MLLPAATARVETPIDGSTGVWLKAGATVISSGMKMTGAVVTSGQSQYVYSRGVAQNTLIAAGGLQHVSAGGSASGCSVTGHVSAYGGALVADMVIENGSAWFLSGASASGIIVGGSTTLAGKMYVQFAGAQADNVTVDFGGYVVAQRGGAVISGVVVKSGGRLYPLYSGSAVDVTVSNGGWVSAGIDGGCVSAITVLSGGSLTVSSGGTGSAITVASGGSCIVSSGGLVHDITVASGGIISPRVGCVLSGVSTDAGLSVYAGMSSYDVVVHGYLYVSGYVSRAQFYSDSSTAGKICLAYAGGVIEDLDIHGPATVLGAYYNVRVHEWRLTVSSGALASAVVVMSGASLTVQSGGTALAVTSNAGAIITVSSGGYIEYVTP